jgi:bifunctional N-acetylglucosamine-1-phosphate-uridyltransferase/glucosamine-1-phosphate-acetyltransferase GlmU-like protein
MEDKLERIFEKLFDSNDSSQLVKDIMMSGILHFDRLVTKMFNHLDKVNDEKQRYISKLIAQYSTEKKSLSAPSETNNK